MTRSFPPGSSTTGPATTAVVKTTGQISCAIFYDFVNYMGKNLTIQEGKTNIDVFINNDFNDKTSSIR